MSKENVQALGESGVGDVIIEAVAKRVYAEALRAGCRIRDNQDRIANEAVREAVGYTTGGVDAIAQVGNKAGVVLGAVCEVQRLTHKRMLKGDLRKIGVDEETSEEVVEDLG